MNIARAFANITQREMVRQTANAAASIDLIEDRLTDIDGRMQECVKVEEEQKADFARKRAQRDAAMAKYERQINEYEKMMAELTVKRRAAVQELQAEDAAT